MELTEKTIDSREVFKGRIIRVRFDTVRLPNGKEGTREVVEHPGGVAILAIDSEDRVLLVRQYRYPFERVLTEIPAGKREPGEPPFITAQRELREEMNIRVTVTEEDLYMTVHHEYPDFSLTMYAFTCEMASPDFVRKEHVNHVWLAPSELPTLDWAAADIPIMKKLAEG